MEAAKLWEDICQLLKRDMESVAYSTWIETGLKPLALENDCLYLQMVFVYMRGMPTKHRDALQAAAIQAAGRDVLVQILTAEEGDAFKNRKPAAPAPVATGLNPKYTFDTFVVGNNNRFAHAASLAVAEAPAEAYNPLFIYGGVGLGKTHLMHAIGHYVQKQNPNARLLYITSENFTNDLISAIQQNKNAEFRERFRNVDVLMVDDIQFIAGRDSTQEEFFHTFNALHTSGKQIVMTSDKPPKDIARLEERLCSRFEWGLKVDIKRPDVETRIAILRKKAESENIPVGDDVLQLIAERVDSNIRELEGSLTRLVAYASLSGRPIDRELAEEALKEVFAQKETKRITCQSIQEAVASYYSITVDDMKSARRSREVAVPRQVAMFLIREMLGMSLPQIGEAFGGRDHTTVMYACQKIQEAMAASPSLSSLVDDIRKLIKDSK